MITSHGRKTVKCAEVDNIPSVNMFGIHTVAEQVWDTLRNENIVIADPSLLNCKNGVVKPDILLGAD